MAEIERDGLRLIEPEWPAPQGVRSLVTTRRGGVSAATWQAFNLARHVGDADAAVAANRARLRGLLPAEPVWLEQIHGTVCVDAGDVRGIVQADASFTTRRGVVCAVMTADCLPVVVCDEAGAVVGVAHAGWRGLAAGVLESLVEAVKPNARGELMAWLGPAIGPRRFQVGAEVRAAFISVDPDADACFVPDVESRFLCDLYGLARWRLTVCGVGRVDGGDYCTFDDSANFFSYRRDARTGRFSTLIWLE